MTKQEQGKVVYQQSKGLPEKLLLEDGTTTTISSLISSLFIGDAGGGGSGWTPTATQLSDINDIPNIRSNTNQNAVDIAQLKQDFANIGGNNISGLSEQRVDEHLNTIFGGV